MQRRPALNGIGPSRETVDYLLGARAGQTMRVTLQTNNGANYFNVLPPGSNTAIAIGANLGNRWTGMVRCSVGTDPKGSVQCSFGVIRRAPGQAEIHLASPGYDVTLHKDRLRALNFAGGTVTSPAPTDRVTFEKQGDNGSIGVNDFYYYIILE